MLPNTLQCTGQPHTAKNYLSHSISTVEVEKLCVNPNYRAGFCAWLSSGHQLHAILQKDSLAGDTGRGWRWGACHLLSEEWFLYTECSHLSVAPVPSSVWLASGHLRNTGGPVATLDSV